MSYSYSQRKKANKRSRTLEQKAIANDIRKGKMPKTFFAKAGDSKLERSPVTYFRQLRKVSKQKLTWRLIGTYNELTKESK